MATLKIEGAWKVYGEEPAVQNLSFDVKNGEMFFILGPSGAGKTSTLKMIAGLESISAGSIYIDDQRVNAVRAWERDVAMAFESYALYPHLSVFENLAFPLRSPVRKEKLSSGQITQRVKDIAEILQIGHLLDRKPGQLSGGQRQRTSLGRALVRQPKAFLMDEPIVHLDAKLRYHMRTELKNLQRNFGITAVYSTPDWSEAIAMADRLAVIRKGQLQQLGTPDDIFNSPANTFVADFVGDPPMNMLKARLQSRNGQLMFDAGPVQLDVPAKLRTTLQNRQYDDGVVLGIRPSGFNTAEQSGNETPIAAMVSVSEPLGRETLVEAKIGDLGVTVKIPYQVELDPGQTIWVGIRPDALNVFDAKTTDRIR